MCCFCNTLYVLVKGFIALHAGFFTANLILAVLLVGWVSAMIMMPVGFWCGIEFYKIIYTGSESLKFLKQLGHPELVLIYLMFISGIIAIAYARPTEKAAAEDKFTIKSLIEEKEETKKTIEFVSSKNTKLVHKVVDLKKRMADRDAEIQRLGATAGKILVHFEHEMRMPIANVANCIEILKNGIMKMTREEIKEVVKHLETEYRRGDTYWFNLVDLAILNTKRIELKKEMLNLSNLVTERINHCSKIYGDDKPLCFDMNIQEDIYINVDPHYMRQVIDNLVINAITFSKKGVVAIALYTLDLGANKASGKVVFTIKDQGIGIPPLELMQIFEAFKLGGNITNKAGGRGLGLALCKVAIESHGGEIDAKSNGVKGAEFIFSIPFNIIDMMSKLNNKQLNEALKKNVPILQKLTEKGIEESDPSVQNQIKKAEEKGIKKGKEEGIKKGFEEGIEKGKMEGKKEWIKEGVKQTAINMIKKNMELRDISHATGLPLTDVIELKKEQVHANKPRGKKIFSNTNE